MSGKNELQSAIRLALIFLVIGVVSYAAGSSGPSETPLRIMYQTGAGRVLFDHAQHTDTAGIGLDCKDCHHDHGDEAMPTVACDTCHVKPPPPDDPDQKRAPLPETIAEKCSECHDPVDEVLPELTARNDAYHGKCIKCHKEFGAGPEACTHCHTQ